jgi:hypothetical protein
MMPTVPLHVDAVAVALPPCECGDRNIFAVRPGAEPMRCDLSEYGSELAILIERGERAQAWCLACWSRRFGGGDERG